MLMFNNSSSMNIRIKLDNLRKYLNVLVLPYPQIKTEPLCISPHQNLSKKTDQNGIIFSLLNILRARCKLFAYPRLRISGILCSITIHIISFSFELLYHNCNYLLMSSNYFFCMSRGKSKYFLPYCQF